MVSDLIVNLYGIGMRKCSNKISVISKKRSNEICLGNCFSESGEVKNDEYLIKKGCLICSEKKDHNEPMYLKRGNIKKKTIINNMNKGFIVDDIEDKYIDEQSKYNYIVNGYWYDD